MDTGSSYPKRHENRWEPALGPASKELAPDGFDHAPLAFAHESTVSSVVLRSILDAASKLGVPPGAVLDAARVPADAHCDSEARVSRARVYRVTEAAVDLTGDVAFGLHWGEQLNHLPLAPVSHLVAHAPSLRHGFQSLQRFHRLFADHPSFMVHEREGVVTLRVRSLAGEPARVERVVSEMILFALLRMLRNFRPNPRVERVCFAYTAPSYHAEYARVFAQAVRFDQPHTELEFDASCFDERPINEDADVCAALEALAEQRLLRITHRTPYASRLRGYMLERGWRSRDNMSAAARALGLSVRSLRRRLEAEGASFAMIAQDALAAVAKQLLRDGGRTIQETSFEMGFADTSTFHRAFRRWTGTTPSAYRRGLVEQG